MTQELRAVLGEKAVNVVYDYVASWRGQLVPLPTEYIRRALERGRIKMREKEFRRFVEYLRHVLEPCRVKELADPIIKRNYNRVVVKYPKKYWTYYRECVMSTLVALKNDPEAFDKIMGLVYIPTTGTKITSVWIETEVWKRLKAMYAHMSDGQIVRLAIYEFLKKWGPFLRALEGTKSGPPLQEASPPSASEHRPP